MVYNPSAYCLPEEIRGTILADITNAKSREISGAKKKWPAEAILMTLDRAPAVRSLKKALLSRPPGIIAELKRATPSRGLLRTGFDHLKIGKELQRAGAAALSVITEVKHFQGQLEFLASLRWHTSVPLLRKDFLVDPYQLLESRHAGADAVLLIAALLDGPSLRRLRKETEDLGMEALVEVHNEAELDRALEAGAGIVGVNNRDLTSFQTSLDVSLRIGARLPKNLVAVSASGIRSREDVRRLTDAGYSGILVGEHLMRAASPGSALRELMPGRVTAIGKAS